MENSLVNHRLYLPVCLLQLAQILSLFEYVPAWVIITSIISYLMIIFNIKYFSAKFFKVITFGSMALILAYYKTLFIPESSISLLMMMGSFKILEIHSKRDLFISILISYLFISAQALFSNTFATFLLMSIFFVWNTVLWHSYFNSSQINYKKSLSYVLKMVTLIAPFAIVLFIFFPRFAAHFLPFGRASDKNVVGFSESVKNSQVSSLESSSRIAFRGKFSTNYSLKKEELYWRGTIHHHTDGFDWEKNSNLNYPVQADLKNQIEGVLSYEIKLDQNFKGLFFTLDTPLLIEFNNQEYQAANEMLVFYSAYMRKHDYYKAKSKLNAVNPKLDKERENIYLQLPNKIKEQYLQLALDLKGDAKNTQEVIAKISEYLITNKYIYTLSPGKMDNLADFIEKKRGFCTHYASFAAIMLRLLNIKARLVSGFQGGEFNPVGEYWIIRDNDAHTWIEFYQEGLGWKKYDPVEFLFPDRLSLGGENLFSGSNYLKDQKNVFISTIFKNYYQLKLHWDNLNFKWTTLLESFNFEYQQELAKLFKIKINYFYLLIIMIFGLIILLYYVIWKIILNYSLTKLQAVQDLYYFNLLSRLSSYSDLPIKDELTIQENLKYFSIKDQNIQTYFTKYQDWKFGQKKFDQKEAKKVFKMAMQSIK